MARKRFRGESVHKVDGKGRVSIPAEFRRVLAQDAEDGFLPEVILVNGAHCEGFLEGYSAGSMQAVEDKIAALDEATPARELLEYNILGKSQTFQVDDTGRIVLPSKLREHLGLTLPGDVCFVGLGETFQIWEASAYEATVAARNQAEVARLPAGVNLKRLLSDPGLLDRA